LQIAVGVQPSPVERRIVGPEGVQLGLTSPQLRPLGNTRCDTTLFLKISSCKCLKTGYDNGRLGKKADEIAGVQLWLPDSPRWLLLSGKGKLQAQAAVERLRGKYADPAVVSEEIEEMAATNQQNQRKTSEFYRL
jgi:hypothetical protein